MEGVKIIAQNRRAHNLWQSSLPSRFIDELPEAHVDIAEGGNSYGGYGNPYGGGVSAESQRQIGRGPHGLW